MAKGKTPSASSVKTANRKQQSLKDKVSVFYITFRSAFIGRILRAPLAVQSRWPSIEIGRILDRSTLPHLRPLKSSYNAVEKLEAVHIIPFSSSANARMRELLGVFSGGEASGRSARP